MPQDEHPADKARQRFERPAQAVRRTDEHPRLVAVAKFLRSRLPGDTDLGDPLSTAGNRPPHVLARQLTDAAPARESLAREVGLGALQVWQAFSEAQGRGRGKEDVTILFTDLVEFSDWALEAGDEAAIELLRRVAKEVEPAVTDHGGKIVKRLGDGLLAVFADSAEAVKAAHEAVEGTARVEVAGHTPALRAGLHTGRPRRVGGDYLGVDVNIAARVTEAAGGGEVLVSESVCHRLEDDGYRLKQKKRFKAKGAPKDLNVFAVERA